MNQFDRVEEEEYGTSCLRRDFSGVASHGTSYRFQHAPQFHDVHDSGITHQYGTFENIRKKTVYILLIPHFVILPEISVFS